MVDIIGRAKVIVSSDVDSTQVQNSGDKIGASLRRGAVVGVAALGALVTGGIKAAKAFEEAESVSRKLNQVLENAGEGRATAGVEKLADELMRLTGIDDEVIKGGQTILATFDSVAESADVMGGTFDRATRVAVDMSTVFGSVESASRTLGKALSDPEKAAALLRRSNVILNEEQKTLIDYFTAAGDAAGAQDVILQALEERYAGTAEAGAKGSERLRTGFEEAQESLGFLLSDLFDMGSDKSVVDLAADATFKFSDSVTEFQKSKDWKELKSDIRTFGKDLRTVSGALGSIIGYLNGMSRKLTGSGLVHWLKEINDLTNPLQLVASTIKNIRDLLNGEWKVPKILRRFLDSGSTQDNGSTDDGPIPDLFRAGGGRASGWTVAGENGPELIEFGSQGGYVHNNSETRRMVSGGNTVNNFYQLFGPESLSQARRDNDWDQKYGTKFGAATQAAAL